MQYANLRTHPEATEEIAEAISWYGARSEEAAAGFIEAVESAVSAVLANPERFPVYMHGARSARGYSYRWKRFPFPTASLSKTYACRALYFRRPG